MLLCILMRLAFLCYGEFSNSMVWSWANCDSKSYGNTVQFPPNGRDNQKTRKLWPDRIFEKPGHGGTGGGNGGKPAKRTGKRLKTGRESAILEIHSQLFWTEMASTAVGVFFCAQGPLEAARRRRRGGHRPGWTGKPPENRLKTAIRGLFLMAGTGRNWSGPLDHAPEVTAADQEGAGFAALEDSIAGRRGKCKGAQRNNAPLER